MFSWFSRSSQASESSLPLRHVLVIDTAATDWAATFAAADSAEAGGWPWKIEVTQAEWADVRVTAETSRGKRKTPLVFVRGGGAPCRPDLVLVRSLVRGLTPDRDYRNQMYALRMAGVTAVNSWESIMNCQERPWLHAALLDLVDAVGHDAFPLIDQQLFPLAGSISFPSFMPCVIKVGHAEAGYGKMRVFSDKDLTDASSLLALHRDYATIEPYIDEDAREYDLRIQKIGPHIRAYKRYSPNWKGNVGTALIEEIAVTPAYARWAELAAGLFGGIDICTVDAIHLHDGSDVILEVNDTASGFMTGNEWEDNLHVAAVVRARLAGDDPCAGGSVLALHPPVSSEGNQTDASQTDAGDVDDDSDWSSDQ
ncbi:synapsin short isoform [Thecamonas trahens ATCC 50062]|uniref:Synapsin short isoform n=1 Tax=Thecamonas trahens ATCC 50062 TaxID=461836 RepID=A0A0L0DHJ1_THETB|nr:synapsin short isoform [Thecamonas trahens ATCC 50062]KNC51782.1 synapsin short isoform [Thecamonas trahens ATCC 50062]|eukprot:XP_013755655.1 synapsin short isoform [Thecamonas trahens ATCC 50062]